MKSQLNQPELLSATRMFQDKVSLKNGETVLAQHPKDQMYYGAKIVNYKSVFERIVDFGTNQIPNTYLLVKFEQIECQIIIN